jgi:hypothetical protein
MLKNRTLIAAAIASALTSSAVQAETLDTRIGKLEFTHDFANGYPTDATVEKLFNEMDFQRAVQAYLWAIPFVSMAQWQYAHTEQLGAENGQAVFLESYTDRLGGLTYNATTPYVLPFIDLAEGPLGGGDAGGGGAWCGARYVADCHYPDHRAGQVPLCGSRPRGAERRRGTGLQSGEIAVRESIGRYTLDGYRCKEAS